MRKIKFRFGEETVTLGELLAATADYRHVEPESVVQLVGVDVNGHEVYEGDTVVIESKYGELAYRAHLRGFATNDQGMYLAESQIAKARRKEHAED